MAKLGLMACMVLAFTLTTSTLSSILQPERSGSNTSAVPDGEGCPGGLPCEASEAAAEAGPDQTVAEGGRVVLDGSASRGSVTRGPLPEVANFSCPYNSSMQGYPSEPLSSYVNYVKNGDFGTDMAEWVPVGQVTIANGFAYSGSKSLLVSATQSTPAFASQKIPDPGSLFLLYVWIYVVYMDDNPLVVELIREWEPNVGQAKIVWRFEIYRDWFVHKDWTWTGGSAGGNLNYIHDDGAWHRLVLAADSLEGTACYWVDTWPIGFRGYCRPGTGFLPPEYLLLGYPDSSSAAGEAYFDKIIIIGTGPGGTYNPIVSHSWDFDDNRDSNGDGNLTNDEDGTGPMVDTVYGDNGDYTVTLTIVDSAGMVATDATMIHVVNVNPVVLGFNLTTVKSGELGLRVAGRKWNAVNMTLYADGTALAAASVTRYPDSPDEQIAWIPGPFDSSKTYEAVVFYEPGDLSGSEVGGNPVWLLSGRHDNYTVIDHHTFNVEQSEKKGSRQRNHVDPWVVNLTGKLGNSETEIIALAMDNGSDDITFTWNGATTRTYFNDNIGPDQPNSPDGAFPFYASDTLRLAIAPGTFVDLVISDDDGGSVTVRISA